MINVLLKYALIMIIQSLNRFPAVKVQYFQALEFITVGASFLTATNQFIVAKDTARHIWQQLSRSCAPGEIHFYPASYQLHLHHNQGCVLKYVTSPEP